MAQHEHLIGRIDENQGPRRPNWEEAYRSHEETYLQRADSPSGAILSTSLADTISSSAGTVSQTQAKSALPTYQELIDSSKRTWDSIYRSLFSIFSLGISAPQSDNSSGIKPIGAPVLQPPPPLQVAETQKLMEELRELVKRIQASAQDSQDELRKHEHEGLQKMMLAAIKRMHAIYEEDFSLRKEQLISHQGLNQAITRELSDTRGQKTETQNRLSFWKWGQRAALAVCITGPLALMALAFKSNPSVALGSGWRLLNPVLTGSKALTDLMVQLSQKKTNEVLSHLDDLDSHRKLLMNRIEDDGKKMQRASDMILEIFVNQKRLEDLKHKTMKYMIRP